MPPVPMYPDQPMENTDGHHRFWMWNGHEINLNEEDLDAYPKPVRTAVLCWRDTSTPEETDLAEYLVWTVEQHDPWDGGCQACGTPEACDALVEANQLGTIFLIKKSAELVRRSRANLARRDWKATA
jgi:hypothetical protein